MLESGQELSARFALARRLGAGGSGEVWLAQDRERNCFVALKILSDHLMQGAAIAALKRECDQVRALDHPNILRIDGLYRSARHVWIAMDHASGGDLSQLRGRGVVEVLRAVTPIAAALAYAHRTGVVHRDVKPSNVLLMSDGTPRLADFGLALTIASATPWRSDTSPQAGRGSPYTMSPQQLDGAAVSTTDDLYAFGAMLYELLSGYPPFYPDVTAERIRLEKPAELPPSTPAAIAQLVDRLLAKSPSDRPADMETVERELSAALAAAPAPAIVNSRVNSRVDSQGGVNESATARSEPPGIRPPGMHDDSPRETLRSEWRRSTSTGASDRELRRQGFQRGLGAAAISLGIAGVAVVFFALPRWVENEKPARYVPAASAVAPEATPEEKEAIDFAALARTKQQAEELRAAIDERLQKLTARAAGQWGGEDYQRATGELAAGDKDFEAREYASAVEHFGGIEPLLATLEQRAGEVLAAQLKAGAAALRDGRSEDARAAFELAARIEADNQVAARGLKRAATLDEVLNLVATAERLEKEGKATAATENFRKALALDTEAPRAAEGVARIEARLAGDAYASAMARGFSALASAEYSNARSAFEVARKIRPGAPEIPQALRQIEQEQRTRIIAAKLETAQALEGGEGWADALKEYRAVVELDPTVASANEGVARVSPRVALNVQLEMYLTQPERLFSQPVRASAREALGRAGAIPNPGPVLTRQIATLDDWLKRADVPVQVALQSDNLTQVTIYRVGALGAFDQRSLELVPGSYTVVGTRPGYRDVRRQIDITPGAMLEPVVIRCEDRI